MAQSPIPPSSWPGAIDTFVDPAASDFETDVHKAEHAKLSAAVTGVETALGAQNATLVPVADLGATYARAQASGFDRWTDDIRDSKLAGFWTALARRDVAPVDIVILGDSVAEGTGASIKANRFIDRFAAAMRALYPVNGVTGGEYVPCFYVNGTWAAWTLAGTITNHLFDYGLGARATELGAAATMTITRTCTSFDLFYVKSAAGGSFTVQIDGGAAVTVNTVAGGTTDGNKWSSGPLAAGNHTVLVTQSAGGTVIIDGAYFYNGDETKGVRVWDASHFGSSVASINAAMPSWGPGNLAAISPALLMFEMGLNDVTGGSIGVTAAVQNVLTNARTYAGSGPSTLLFGMYERQNAYTGPNGGWDVYYPFFTAAAVNDGLTAFIDLWGRWQGKVHESNTGSGWANPYGWVSNDQIHPSDAGHLALSEQLVDFVKGGSIGVDPLARRTEVSLIGLLRPTGALAETIPRAAARLEDVNFQFSPGGDLDMFAIGISAGTPVGHITFLSGDTAGAALTHQWFGLFDKNRNLLAVTSDDLATAWAAKTPKTLAIASTVRGTYVTYVVPTTDLYYLGIVVSGTTVPSLRANTTKDAGRVIAPLLAGSSNTGLSAPQTPGAFTAAALSGFDDLAYAYVS